VSFFKYALINVTTNPWTQSINVKIAGRAWKQVRMGEKGDFLNLPSNLSNYVNQEFSKCQRCWRGRDLEEGTVNGMQSNQLDRSELIKVRHTKEAG